MLYWLVTAISLIAVLLNIHGHVACFVLWSLTNAAWTYADLTHGLHAQAALQAVYFVLSLYGLWKWTHRKEGVTHGKEDPNRRL